jgi:predicted nucleotidyltransferase
MPAVHERVPVSDAELAEFCRRNHIRRLAFFGSVLSDDFRPDSDIDVLVEFEPGKAPGLGFFALEEELSRMLGRPVDLNTPGFLSPLFRDQMRQEEHYVAR